MTEWKEYKLGEIGVVITGNTPSKKNPEQWGDRITSYNVCYTKLLRFHNIR